MLRPSLNESYSINSSDNNYHVSSKNSYYINSGNNSYYISSNNSYSMNNSNNSLTCFDSRPKSDVRGVKDVNMKGIQQTCWVKEV